LGVYLAGRPRFVAVNSTDDGGAGSRGFVGPGLRLLPQSGLSFDIVRIRQRTSAETGGRPRTALECSIITT